MSYKVKLLPEALKDINEIVKWVIRKNLGWVSGFYEALKIKLNIIKIYPLHYQINYRDFRNIMVDKFPYQIHYKVDQLENLVLVFCYYTYQ